MAIDLIALEDLTLAAGREIMAVYATDFETITKSDGSPVTLADQRAEALILAGLSKLFPGAPVVAEEQMEAGILPRLKDTFFLVDPLDGTRDFVERRAGEFTVNIGMIENGAPIAGVVYAPASGALYSGADGKAFHTMCDPQKSTRVGSRDPIHVSDAPNIRVLTNRSASSSMDQFLDVLGVKERRSISSSIKLALLAAGEAELYPRFGPTNEWDIAAGHGVLRAAGGDLMRRDGSPMTYGQRAPDFLVRGFFAYAPSIERKLRDIIVTH
jgi:3'(2'),5'-bisphosphate nucleotidase